MLWQLSFVPFFSHQTVESCISSRFISQEQAQSLHDCEIQGPDCAYNAMFDFGIIIFKGGNCHVIYIFFMGLKTKIKQGLSISE